MQSFQLASHVNEQGILQIQLPPNLANQDIDIVLMIQPIVSKQTSSNPALLKELVGAFEGDSNLSENYKELLTDHWNKKHDHC
jgi:hypothetical protein